MSKSYTEGLKCYLVGGAVRDQLLGDQDADRDWVVVGSTPDELISRGFKPVGKDFPVFLHPETKEEYALARTERKSGKGYKGFNCYFSTDVTLEQDLLRRDLTINAIAQDTEGKLIDPYGGLADLENRILRHVSDAFEEDPLRVLRAARFVARLSPHGFAIAPETLSLMKTMSRSGELTDLTVERVWHETQKALATNAPHTYFETLFETDAFKQLFEELCPDAEDCTEPMKQYLQHSVSLTDNTDIRFSSFVLGIGTKHDLPAKLIQFSQRLRLPKRLSQLLQASSQYQSSVHNVLSLSPQEQLELLERLGAFKPHSLFEACLRCCLSMTNASNFSDYPPTAWLLEKQNILLNVPTEPLIAQGLQGREIGEAIHQIRLRSLSA